MRGAGIVSKQEANVSDFNHRCRAQAAARAPEERQRCAPWQSALSERRLRMGVAGLGRAFTLMLPTLAADARVELVAAADPRDEATRRFARDFGARTYRSVDELCADAAIEVVYIATPHQMHAAHVALAAGRGKHVLVEKPMAITLRECRAMIEAAASAGVTLMIGHSHSCDRPIQRAREIIADGALGAVRMIQAQYSTDFLYRPRRPEELVTALGGGVVFSQGAHQVDIVRLLGGGHVHAVRALTGAWDPSRPTEGAYAALLSFDDGAIAVLSYSGYGHFDGDEFCGGISELGRPKSASDYGAARRRLAQVGDSAEEAALKQRRNYGGADGPAPPRESAVTTGHVEPLWHEHFGTVIVSCERGDLRPLPTGVMIYGDGEARMEPLPPPRIPRVEVIDELHAAIVDGRKPLHDGRWAMATLEVCLAMLESARERRDIVLLHQVGIR
jgi:phthalate 4,5-cis-dihydrodiol dehydrogenase